jgi:RNA polymerase sigma-70 factor (family 1)
MIALDNPSMPEREHGHMSEEEAINARLGELYLAYRTALVRYAQSLNHSDEDAAEVVQDVFAHMMEERHVLERQQNPVAFLFRSVRNHALNRIRGERTFNRELTEYGAYLRTTRSSIANSGEMAVLDAEIEARLAELVEQLPDKQREAFRLVRFCGVPYAEVARMLNVRFSTVATHVLRASHTLATQLDQLGLFDGSIRSPSRSTWNARATRKMRVHKERSRRVI